MARLSALATMTHLSLLGLLAISKATFLARQQSFAIFHYAPVQPCSICPTGHPILWLSLPHESVPAQSIC